MALPKFEMLVSAAAAVLTGIWFLYRFWTERRHVPKMETRIEVSCYPLDSKSKLVTAKLYIANIGKIAVKPETGQIKLQQIVLKCSKNEEEINEFNYLGANDSNLLWPQIGNREWKWNSENKMLLEPGESERLEADFIVLNRVELLRVYGFIKNPANRDIGWSVNHTFSISEKCK